MKYIKSETYPRAVVISKQESLTIYPEREVGRRIPVVFNRQTGTAFVEDEIADFIVGKYHNVSYLVLENAKNKPPTKRNPKKGDESDTPATD